MKIAAAILTLFAVFGYLVEGGISDWDYHTQHKPMAQAMWAWIEFDKCLKACEEDQLAICAKVGVPHEQCPIDCTRCDVYKEKK